jgi:hypothetical protein
MNPGFDGGWLELAIPLSVLAVIAIQQVIS